MKIYAYIDNFISVFHRNTVDALYNDPSRAKENDRYNGWSL